MRQHTSPLRIPYEKLPEALHDISDARLTSKSLLKSMKEYQGFWKPVDMRKKRSGNNPEPKSFGV